MNRLIRFALLPGAALVAAVLLFVPAGARALTNLTASVAFTSVDPACENPVYTISGTADFETFDFVAFDIFAVVAHDGTGHFIYHVDLGISGAAQPFSTPVTPSQTGTGVTGFFSSGPLTIRIHDVTGFVGGDGGKEAIEFALGAPVLFEAVVDPAADATECAGLPVADASLRTESFTNAAVQSVGTTATPLDLNIGGSTLLTIGVPGDSMLAAFFSAECSNEAADDTTFTDVTIRVDGLVLPPTATGNALCTANGSFGNDQWVMARTSGATLVSGPAVHTVAVEARSSSAAGDGRLADTSLVVLVPEPSNALLRWSGLAVLAALARGRRGSARRRGFGVALLAAGLVLGGAASPARAGTEILKSSNTANQSFIGTGSHLLDFGEGNGTSFLFSADRGSKLVIAFSAECAVDAPDTSTWLDLDLTVDSVVIAPTDAADAFCTSAGGGTGRWVSPAFQAVADVGPGLHLIRVEGVPQNAGPADRWSIGDLSLVVIIIEE